MGGRLSIGGGGSLPKFDRPGAEPQLLDSVLYYYSIIMRFKHLTDFEIMSNQVFAHQFIALCSVVIVSLHAHSYTGATAPPTC